MSKKVYLKEKDYRTLELLAKKFGFKDVDELVANAIIGFFSKTYDWGIDPQDTEKFLIKMDVEAAKNPDFRFAEFLKKWNAAHKNP